MQDPRRVRFPPEEVWDGDGPVSNTCEGHWGAEAVRAWLRRGQVRFAVVDAGLPLRWIAPDACFTFWKEEVRSRLIEPSVAEQGVSLEDLPGGYGYLASV